MPSSDEEEARTSRLDGRCSNRGRCGNAIVTAALLPCCCCCPPPPVRTALLQLLQLREVGEHRERCIGNPADTESEQAKREELEQRCRSKLSPSLCLSRWKRKETGVNRVFSLLFFHFHCGKSTPNSQHSFLFPLPSSPLPPTKRKDDPQDRSPGPCVQGAGGSRRPVQDHLA